MQRLETHTCRASCFNDTLRLLRAGVCRHRYCDCDWGRNNAYPRCYGTAPAAGCLHRRYRTHTKLKATKRKDSNAFVCSILEIDSFIWISLLLMAFKDDLSEVCHLIRLIWSHSEVKSYHTDVGETYQTDVNWLGGKTISERAPIRWIVPKM